MDENSISDKTVQLNIKSLLLCWQRPDPKKPKHRNKDGENVRYEREYERGNNSCRRRSEQGLAEPLKVDVHVSSSSHFATLSPRRRRMNSRVVSSEQEQELRSANQSQLSTDIKLDVDIRDIRCPPQS